MSLKNRLSYAAAVAKWKTDQQLKLVRSQNKVRDIENRIGSLKTELGEITFQLLSEGQSLHEDLNPTYESIVGLGRQIEEQQVSQDEIKNEDPPRRPASLDESIPISKDKLICPECNKPIVGVYCPKHGVEGIPFVNEPEVISETTPIMICPNCKKELSVRFCPEHGLEGVPE